MARPWKHPKTGIYWLRRAVPADLRAAVGKREEKQSLGTKDPAQARVLHAKALAAIEERWAGLRRPLRAIEPQELEEASRFAYRVCLSQNGAPGIQWDLSLGQDLWIDQLSMEPGVSSRDLSKTMHRSWCRQRAGEYLAHVGLNLTDEDREKVAKAIGFGAHKACLALQAQAHGDFRADPFIVEAAPGARLRGVATKPLTFKSLLDGWAAEKAPVSKTLYSWEKVIDQVKSFVGHDDASRLTPDDLLRWKADLLEQGLKTKTIRDSKIAPLRAILQWGVDNRKIADNPAARIQIDVRGKAKEKVRGYSDEEAKLILERAAKEADPVLHWIPLLSAYSGARISEVCQLRKEDVLEVSGVWCLKFVPEAGSLKNANSERIVPVHPAVLDDGFLKFVSASKPGPLFSKLRVDRFGNRGGTGTKMISRWIRSLGISDDRISPSHSWRHRFKTLGRRHGLMPDIVNAMTGHHTKTVADAYGEFPVEALHRELIKIPRIPI